MRHPVGLKKRSRNKWKRKGVRANMAQDSISDETETLVAWLFGRVIVRAEAYYWPR